MITLQDIEGNEARGKDRYGFKVPITSQALDVVLRKTFDLPEGDVERIEVDEERMIVTFYYRSDAPKTFDGKVQQPCPGRIGQAGEYPIKCEVKK
jgi:hypothetical protein